MEWWGCDELHLIASHLPARSLGLLSCTCTRLHSCLTSPRSLSLLASLRASPLGSGSLLTLEQLSLSEEISSILPSAAFFSYASLDVEPDFAPVFARLAALLARHRSLTLSLEGHCGLEAGYSLLQKDQAKEISYRRAEAVAHAIQQEAAALGLGNLKGRLTTRGWGYSKPLVWAVALPSEDGGEVPAELEALAAMNRRVEIFLRCDGYELPRRRSRAEIPRPPPVQTGHAATGAPGRAWLSSFEEYDTDDCGGEHDPYTPGTEHGESLVLLEISHGRRMALPITLLRFLELLPEDDDTETDSEDEDGGAFLGLRPGALEPRLLYQSSSASSSSTSLAEKAVGRDAISIVTPAAGDVATSAAAAFAINSCAPSSSAASLLPIAVSIGDPSSTTPPRAPFSPSALSSLSEPSDETVSDLPKASSVTSPLHHHASKQGSSRACSNGLAHCNLMTSSILPPVDFPPAASWPPDSGMSMLFSSEPIAAPYDQPARAPPRSPRGAHTQLLDEHAKRFRR